MKKKYKGFTIIEILIVISILAILSAIVFVIVPNSRAKARDLIRKNHTSQLYLAIELYNNQVGKLPDFGRPLCLSITEADSTCYVTSSNLDGSWDIFISQIAQYVGSVEPDPCPDCTLSQSFITKVFGAEEPDNYEYVYEAPAMILSLLTQNEIDPATVGFKASSFRIYAKNLERGGGPYAFGINLGEYNLAANLSCSEPRECLELCESAETNYLESCLWLWENDKPFCEKSKCRDILFTGETNLCEKDKDLKACLWLSENEICKETCMKILIEGNNNLCIKESNLNACLWLYENKMCEDLCLNMLFEGQRSECEKNKDFVACEWLWNNNRTLCEEGGCKSLLIEEKNRLCKEEKDENACKWLKENGY